MERIEHAQLYCNKCKTDKPTSEYHKCKARPTGYQSFCKVCQNKTTKAYRDRTNCKWWKHKEGQMFSIYKITNPEGFVYIGYTSTNPKLRFQRHKAQHKCDRGYKIPLLYNSFDTYAFEDHTFEVIAECPTDISARQAETREILNYIAAGRSLNSSLSAFPVAQYTKEGEFLKNWNSVEEACVSFGVQYRSSWIYAALTNIRHKTAHGYVWKPIPFEDGTTYDFKTKTVTLCKKD